MADPLSIIGAVASGLQFIQFGTKVIYQIKTRHTSVTGQRGYNLFIKKSIQELENLLRKVETTSAGLERAPQSGSVEEKIVGLCHKCRFINEELKEAIKVFENRSYMHNMVSSSAQSLVKDVEAKLRITQDQLVMALLVALW
mgnify:CR=1 FL=1|jgi:hypothetical protein